MYEWHRRRKHYEKMDAEGADLCGAGGAVLLDGVCMRSDRTA